jgi:hypothetical protein
VHGVISFDDAAMIKNRSQSPKPACLKRDLLYHKCPLDVCAEIDFVYVLQPVWPWRSG